MLTLQPQRIIDIIPLAIDHTFVFELADMMQNSLVQKLHVGNLESAQNYLSEDSAVRARREELMAQRKRLESMQELFGM